MPRQMDQLEHTKRSAVVKRSIVINSHKTSVSLENEFWFALREIAKKEYVAINTLVARIDGSRGSPNLSSAIRIYVLSYFRRAYEQHIASSHQSVGIDTLVSKE